MLQPSPDLPKLRTVGVDGMLVSFADTLGEAANRAALAFSAAVRAEGWDAIEEVSISLVSTYVRFDPVHLSHADLALRLGALLEGRDWLEAELPAGRKLWRIPTVYGTAMAPQLGEAAQAAGLTEAEAVAALSGARVRVQTIGFAPGQPYLGTLPPEWDLPRQSALTPRVPEGALVQAIRQFVLFSVSAPTGWRHVGQTAIRLFRPESDAPFVLRPGDEVEFTAVSPDTLERMRAEDRTGDGGATCEALA